MHIFATKTIFFIIEGKLREAVVREALLQHPDQTARPAIAYPQFDKISTAWKLSLPGPTTGLTSPVFKEVMAIRDARPAPARPARSIKVTQGPHGGGAHICLRGHI